MLKNFNKILIIMLILFYFLSTAYAIDESDNTLKNQNQSNIYFDANCSVDGDGTYNNPYKFFNSSRIKNNSNLYLANGEYELENSVIINNINIYGVDCEKTIIKSDNMRFNIVNTFSIENITLKNSSINNTSKLTVKNTIFEGGSGVCVDSYENICGGAIYSYNKYLTSVVNITNCTFKNTHAEYGGSIYINGGVLNIDNTDFINISAYEFGGSIVCENTKATISKSKFINQTSLNDVGGAIYLKSSTLIGDNLEFIDSKAEFGASITSLKSTISLMYSKFINNSAKNMGGVIYQIYGIININNCEFINNTSINSSVLSVDNVSDVNINSNIFSNNIVLNASSVINLLFSNNSTDIEKSNYFYHNNVSNVSESSELNLILKSGNYTLVKNNITLTDLPSYYSLIDENQVTNIKNQGSSGNCWAFTAMSVIESCLLKATNMYFDLSEENLKNIMALYSHYGWNVETNNGGHYYMPFGYLTSWIGPVSENDDKFDDKSTLSTILNSIFHIQNIKFLKRDNFTDNDEIKRVLIQYGAVGVGMSYYDSFFNNNSNSYYCFLNRPLNHAVSIVGWDDNYSKNNFKYNQYLPGDGAWIVKNSWGNRWGDEGYFYVSYYDMNFAKNTAENPPYTIIFNDTVKYDKNYQYDISGITNYFSNVIRKVWYKNIFTAGENEYLAAVSTYFDKLTNWTVSIIVNNQVKLIQNGFSSGGYYTIKLDEFIPLNKGDVFEVIFNTSVKGKSSVPISQAKTLNKQTYTSGISYLSYDNRYWQDLSNLTFTFMENNYTSQVACIKAFTIINPINVYLNVCNKNILKVVDEFGNSLNKGNVTFNIDGEKYTVDVKDGIAEIPFKKAENIFEARFECVGYKTSQINISSHLQIKYEINQNNIFIDFINNDFTKPISVTINDKLYKILNNSLKLFNLSNGFYHINIACEDEVLDFKEIEINVIKTDITLTKNQIKLVDGNHNHLYNKTVEVMIDNDKFYFISDVNGIVNLPISHDSNVEVFFNGDNNYFKSNISKCIQFMDINLNYNLSPNLTILKFNSSKNINDTLEIVINNDTYNIEFSDGMGILTLYNLSNGIYNINIACSEYILNNESFVFEVKQLKNTRLYVDNITVFYNYGVFKAILYDLNFNIISDAVLSVNIDNQIFNITTDKSGEAFLTLNLTNLKTYFITTYYNGNDEYCPCEVNSTINVISSIKSKNYNSVFGSVVNFTVEVLYTGNISIIIGDEEYIFTTIDAVSLPLNLEAGNHSIHITNQLTKECVINTVNINPISTKIIASPISADYGVNKYLIATLKDADGNPVRNAKVNVKIACSSYMLTSDLNGQIKINVNGLNVKSYQVNISFEGGKNYIKSSNVVRINILKTTTKLIAYKKVFRIIKTKKYIIKLKTSKNNAVINVKITLKINGRTYLARTDNKGKAIFNLKLSKKGNFNAIIKFNGNNNFKSLKKSVKILVKK